MSLTNKLAQKISTELNYDEEKSAVISYGLFAFLQILASLSIVALLGVLLGVVFQALVVSFVSSILRQYSGGVHATRPSICLIIGTIATILITMTAHYLVLLISIEYLITIIAIVMAISYYMIFKYAPVDSPAKPIKTQSKRKKMKKLSLIILSIYVVFIFALIIAHLVNRDILYVEFAMCICLATGWQVFNLTIKGHRFLKKLDSIINKIFFLKKGEIS